MNDITFVIGGCRSGKSSHAQNLAESLAEKNRVFIATCIPYDDEMKERVENHRKARDKTWATIEAPVLLAKAVCAAYEKADVILVDCLTLWLSNLLLDPEQSENIQKRIDELIKAINQAPCPVILVSNEVGQGIVPENWLARQYRDLMGNANRQIATAADTVIWLVAGIPVTIKRPLK